MVHIFFKQPCCRRNIKMIYAFLLIGQSNMAGRGKMDEVEPIVNKHVLMFRDHKWQKAVEPIHDDKPELAGIGLGMSFADDLQKITKKTIGLIPCAVGGTSLDEWKKGGELYSKAVNTTKEALRESVLKGILWHQGEADSGTYEKASSYKDRFLSMINSMMEDLNCKDIPVIIGGLGAFLQFHNGICNYWSVINHLLEQLCSERNNFAFVSAEGLTDNGDTLHFNSESLREFGKRYARAWLSFNSKWNM